MAIRTSTETKLLDAADELFFSVGIAATPVDAVLARAGVSAATLYRGYASKEALVAAALERRHAEWIQVWDAAIAAQQTAVGKLLAIFDALDSFRSRPEGSRWCAFLGSAAEYADPPAEIRDAVARDTGTMRSRLQELAAAAGSAQAADIADQLVLVVSGDLAMRLREQRHNTGTARAVAAALIRDL